MTGKVGFLTYAGAPGLCSDDRLVLAPLAELGVAVVPVPWQRAEGELGDLDALVLRSCWDYHLHPREFADFLGRLEKAPIPVWNPPRAGLWNMDKSYLLELEAKGASLPRTRLITRGARAPGEELFAALAAEELVIKPAISLNGHETRRFPRAEAAQASQTIGRLLEGGDVLVQEFLPEIEAGGELSFVFFEGFFSHALRKRPKAGEFRVQAEHGGSREAIVPRPELIAQAQGIASLAGEGLLFCRVDAVERDGRLVLMELELLDPMLYFADGPGSAERFAQALSRRLGAIRCRAS